MRTYALLAAACAALVGLAESDEAARVVRLRDEARRFNAAAARLAVEDLARDPSYGAARHRAAVEALAARRDWAVAHLNPTNADGRAEAIALVEGYRAALLANPRLDADRILCVRRHLKNSVWPTNTYGTVGGSDGPPHTKRALSRDLGLLGLNAHNHMDLRRTGFTNEIAVISNLRATPAFTTLYRPSDTSIVRDLDLDFDASRILFTSYRGTNNLLGVYEVKVPGAECSKPQLVSPEDGHYDIQWWDGCYLPNKDQIILLGTGAYQFLPCEDGNFPMCVLYRVDRRTGETIQLTYEQDSDYTPVVLNDGRVAYTRWEYSDIQHYFSRELMTMNPDGIGQLALWGSGSYFPTFFCGARSVPDDPHLLVMMAGGHHGRAEHGRMLLLDPTLARKYPVAFDPPDREWGPPKHALRIPTRRFPARETGLVHEFPGRGETVEGDLCDLQVDNQFARGKPYFAHPWPLGGAYFLASAKLSNEGRFGIYLVDSFDNIVLLAEADDGALFEPILLAPRKRPPVIPDRRVPGAKTATVHIADIYNGPGLAGVPRGTVKKLRVFAYHFCYHRTGGHVSTGLDKVEAGWDLKRVLGTVDVEPDGSACFEMPANTPVSFQPLDADGAAVQLMRSWTVGMPGERVSCTGCHEDNRTSITTSRTQADRKPIQKITPPDADGIRPWGFANELYPHLISSCASCHGRARPPDAPQNFTSTPESAYRFLHPYIRRGGAESELPILNPLEFHASTSPLVQMLKKGHHSARLDADGWRQLYTWIDLNCVFYGKWGPKGFKSNSFVLGCTNQVERRKELLSAYADLSDDPEAEYDRYAALLATRLAAQAEKKRQDCRFPEGRQIGEAALPPLPSTNSTSPFTWPLSTLQAADLQLGAIDQIAPVTTKTLILGAGTSMTFRRIPAGAFIMGSATGYPDETPRVVRIDKPFWLSEMEVDNAQYHTFDPQHDSRSQDQWGFDQVMPGHVGNHRRQPVVRVSREEAAAFCAWLSTNCNVRAALPTEEQWEWAARAGTDTPFPWGGLDDDFGKYANFADKNTRWMYSTWDGASSIQVRRPYKADMNYPLRDDRFEDDWFTLNFTGRARCNLWGLYDMHGNAAEWTSTTTPDGRAVARGGSFASRPKDATSSFKTYYLPWQKVYDVGFRVMLEETN
ncbi:MAG: SUMF1/EgtB/PvdO family nonheme iron enzyme [Kiritimatiellae bacterium]|nr:SUMF1/EgtB/PvdO family nonheme iron enzyme [Kiritimatiellia bacterium]